MGHTEEHPLSGKKVELKVDEGTRTRELDPQTSDIFEVEDWWDRDRTGRGGPSWREMKDSNWAAMWYSLRVASGKIPDDDECVYGKITTGTGANLGHIVHVTELGEVLG